MKMNQNEKYMFNLKKFVAKCLIATFLLQIFGVVLDKAFASEMDLIQKEEIVGISKLDALIVAAMALKSEDGSMAIVSDGSSCDYIELLFDADGSVIAFYVCFSPTGYAVVNNNAKNPTLIEFGEGKQDAIESARNESGNQIVYNNP